MWGVGGCRGIRWVLVRDPKPFCPKLGVGLGEAGKGKKLRWVGGAWEANHGKENALLTLEIGAAALFADGPEGWGGGCRGAPGRIYFLCVHEISR